jgi:hypothetical protein
MEDPYDTALTLFKQKLKIRRNTMPVPGKYRSGCSPSSIGWEHRAPNGGARESTQRAKGVCNPIGGITI